MTDITYPTQNLAQEAQNVTTALRGLGQASWRLAVAMFNALAQYRQPSPELIAAEAAANLRAYADTLSRRNPRYAQDLYAAADRHERDASSF